MVLGALAAAGIGAAANLYEGEKGRRERRDVRKGIEEAEAVREADRQRILGTELPKMTPVELERFADKFDYSPEELQAIMQEQSSLETYQGDPRLQQSQMDALAQLAEVSQGGLTDSDRAAMTESQLEAGRADRGRQEAILQSMARRGMAGGGQELASRLASSQGASDRAAGDQRAMVQGAQQRALEAMARRGALAGDIRGQGFSEAERRAAATDRINAFNTANRRDVQAANIRARNEAALLEQKNRQRLADANTRVAQTEAQQPNQIAQQEFTNKMSREGAAGGFAIPTASAGMRMDAINAGGKQIKELADFAGAGAKTAIDAYNKPDSEQGPTGRTKMGEPIYG